MLRIQERLFQQPLLLEPGNTGVRKQFRYSLLYRYYMCWQLPYL